METDSDYEPSEEDELEQSGSSSSEDELSDVESDGSEEDELEQSVSSSSEDELSDVESDGEEYEDRAMLSLNGEM
ncbi:hypothetical protein QE152_g26495 [Popillia japonica]|uniref:Uncharacterized protein n=1 Tax=Popillia japonica TaxID=7064 RepID=A0AAW1JY23_POPJA